MSEEGSIPGSFLREEVHDPRTIAAVRSKIGTMEMRTMLSGFSLQGKMEDPWKGRGAAVGDESGRWGGFLLVPRATTEQF